MAQNNIQKSIIKTLAYSDVFDYPLKREEVFRFLMDGKYSEEKVSSCLKLMVKAGAISRKNNLFFLNGREKICSIRKTRGVASLKKMKLGRKVSKILSIITSVRLVGISGSLSMNNAEKKDDIDLFIITSANMLWTTRFAVNLILLFWGIKRGPGDTLGIDRICPNMFVSENALGLDKNMFAAHEIAQLKVLINKKCVYENFIASNSWVLDFLPNSVRSFSSQKIVKSNKFATLVDRVFYEVQYAYMKKKKTSEEVTLDIAKFHPKDKTLFVLNLYKRKYNDYFKYLSGRVKTSEMLSL